VRLERLLDVSANENDLARAADEFFFALPREPDRTLALPPEPDTVILAAARAFRRLTERRGAPDEQEADRDCARYGASQLLAGLGMWAAKRQLEDVVLEAEMPERSAQIARLFKEFRESSQAFVDSVEAAVRAELNAASIEATVSSVWCSVDGAARRMQSLRLPNLDVFSRAHPTDFYDLYVVVSYESACYLALEAIHRAGMPQPGTFQDFIVAPHLNGFSGLTTRIKRERNDEGNVKTETINAIIQTELMNTVAWHGLAHPACDDRRPDTPAFIQTLRDNSTRRLPRSEITVYSIGGNRLQKTTHQIAIGATVLDLAYRIHEQIGNDALSATVNGSLVDSLGHVLQPESLVEIHRDERRRNVRTEDDLERVTLPYARTRLKRGLNKRDPQTRGRLAIRQHLVDRGLVLRGSAELDRFVEAALPSLHGKIEDRSVAGVYRHVGNELKGDTDQLSTINAGAVAAMVADELLKAGAERLLGTDTPVDQWRPAAPGHARFDSRFAKLCGHCRPKPPEDRIVGVQQRSRVTVHIPTCRHARERDVIGMRWIHVEGRVRSIITVTGADRSRLIIDVCEQISRLGCGLDHLIAKADQYGKARLNLHVFADSSETITQLVELLHGVKGVGAVQRQTSQAPARGIGRRGQATTLRGLSRSDRKGTIPLQLREGTTPFRHTMIHVPYNLQQPRFDGRLYGREREVAELVRRTHDSDSPYIFISGPRTIGKSSLALRFSDELAERHRPHVLRVDLRSTQDGTARDAFDKIVTEFRAKTFAPRVEPDPEHPEATLDRLITGLGRRRLLLILDEFGGPLASFKNKKLGPGLFDWIRTRMDREHPELTVLMAAPPEAEMLLRTMKTDLDRVTTFTLGPLAAEGARQLLVDPLEHEGIRLRNADADHAVALCGANPYYLINLLYKLGQHLDEDRYRWAVGRADIERAARELLADRLPFSRWIIESGPDPASRTCLDALARMQRSPTEYVGEAEIARAARTELADAKAAMERFLRHQVVEVGTNGGYRIAFPLLRRWIRSGGIRRDLFDPLTGPEQQTLGALCEAPDAGAGLKALVAATRLPVDSMMEALDGLVAAKVVLVHNRRYQFPTMVLKAWVEENRNRAHAR
jgi:(p)ppGpp synthase/HD superfamily hydrolase